MNKCKILISLLAVTMLASCGGGNQYVDLGNINGYADLASLERKDTFSTYVSTMPSTLNSATTNQQEDSQHIVNFVDGLVENDRFGNIVPSLGESWETNAAKDTYTFHIRKNVPWVTWDGQQYKDKTVKPSDFYTSARYALNFDNLAEGYYLLALIIDGANEYWQATFLNSQFKNLSENIRYSRIATRLNEMGITPGCTAKDVEKILKFERVGISYDDAAMTLTYKLKQRADYFPTMLTYSAYLPMQEEFVSSVGFNNFGSDKDKILYCGAYLLDEWDPAGTRMVYKKNPYYWDKDHVTTSTLIFNKLPTNIRSDYAHEQYKSGQIDSFVLTDADVDGWNEYVLGKDGTGTLENPAHPNAFSNYGEGSKSPFIYYLNQNRETNSQGTYNTSLRNYVDNVEASITNTNKALKYSYFRQAVLNSLDLEAYYLRFSVDNEQIRSQYAINTYTPRDFAKTMVEKDGQLVEKDYFDFLCEEYASKHNVSLEKATEKLEPMNPYASKISLEESMKQIKDACDRLKKDDPSITFPIYLENVGIAYDEEQRSYDDYFIEASNEAMNGIIFDEDIAINDLNKIYGTNATDSDVLVRIINNTNIASATDYTNASDYHAFSIFVSGWIPDFEDPLTFLNTATLGGDMSQHFGTNFHYVNADDKSLVNDGSLSEETFELFVEYDSLVRQADLENEDISKRYQLFAKAEIMLLEEMGILRPLYMTGLGYQVSVSNIIPYRTPRAGYGTSNDKYKGLEVLKQALTKQQRQALKNEWEREKAESKK